MLGADYEQVVFIHKNRMIVIWYIWLNQNYVNMVVSMLQKVMVCWGGMVERRGALFVGKGGV